MKLLTICWEFIYYYFRNHWYYYTERINSSLNLDRKTNMHQNRKMVTSHFLKSVGLKVVDESENNLPRHIPLSKKQKEWVKKANENGFKVGVS